MTYDKIVQAVFLNRPNRFLAYCMLDGQIVEAHVKNTSRCRELLIPGSIIYLQHHPEGKRKTRYSLIAVEKGNILVNIDSQAPNQVVEEALRSGVLSLPEFGVPETVRREVTVGKSRLDFSVSKGLQNGFIEVKGVTLEENGILCFPDAPTDRGVKHLRELTALSQQGYHAYAVFIIQMDYGEIFRPNDRMDLHFAEALREASDSGVIILAHKCKVTPNTISIGEPLMVRL